MPDAGVKRMRPELLEAGSGLVVVGLVCRLCRDTLNVAVRTIFDTSIALHFMDRDLSARNAVIAGAEPLRVVS